MQESTFITDAANDAHSRRVAAYCGEIAQELALSDTMRNSLLNAARLHHTYREWQDEASAAALFGVPTPAGAITPGSIETSILEGNSTSDLIIRSLSEALEMADQFDESLEHAPFTEQTRSAMLDTSHPPGSEDPAVHYVLSYLRSMSRAEVTSLVPRLPVCPSAALRALRVDSDSPVAVQEFVSIAKSDPVLGGTLLQAANSALFGTRSEIRVLHQAVAFLGIELTRKILVGAALKPLLGTPRLQGLWSHSIESALTAQAIARMVPGLDADEAYTLGLLHDVGRLLLELVPRSVLERQQRLRDGGVETTIAELVTCGVSHAEAGADVLRSWKLPEEYASAVEFHHEPNRCDSILASLLYVVEFWTASEEDLPSNVRLTHALKRLSITANDLEKVKIGNVPAYLT